MYCTHLLLCAGAVYCTHLLLCAGAVSVTAGAAVKTKQTIFNRVLNNTTEGISSGTTEHCNAQNIFSNSYGREKTLFTTYIHDHFPKRLLEVKNEHQSKISDVNILMYLSLLRKTAVLHIAKITLTCPSVWMNTNTQ